ncbi:hypothetical protein BDR07DRAFT_1444181 [Suillus spraguei]|nr:hypothetical protein BDR07DRAFT_1444181 [Suillus spraguei]
MHEIASSHSSRAGYYDGHISIKPDSILRVLMRPVIRIIYDIMRVSLISRSLLLPMMYYHDGLRTITAERARHSSILSGTPS